MHTHTCSSGASSYSLLSRKPTLEDRLNRCPATEKSSRRMHPRHTLDEGANKPYLKVAVE